METTSEARNLSILGALNSKLRGKKARGRGGKGWPETPGGSFSLQNPGEEFYPTWQGFSTSKPGPRYVKREGGMRGESKGTVLNLFC